jgi:hypothetical protein
MSVFFVRQNGNHFDVIYRDALRGNSADADHLMKIGNGVDLSLLNMRRMK